MPLHYSFVLSLSLSFQSNSPPRNPLLPNCSTYQVLGLHTSDDDIIATNVRNSQATQTAVYIPESQERFRESIIKDPHQSIKDQSSTFQTTYPAKTFLKLTKNIIRILIPTCLEQIFFLLKVFLCIK